MENYEEKYMLIQHEAKCQSYRDSNKFAIEFSKMALRGAFWLNGACIIPILYSRVTEFYGVAFWFACGAFSAALATGATYILQFLIMLTWEPDIFKRPYASYPEACKEGLGVRHGLVVVFRVLPVLLILAAYTFFGTGLWEAKSILTKPAIPAAVTNPTQQQSPAPVTK